jgi:hypothetical protein
VGALGIDWKLVATVGIPGALVVAGWFFVHLLNARRDLAQRKREARLKALETAYIRLADSANRPLTDEILDELELFVSEIQLYGTPRQVELMGKVVEGLKVPNNPVDFNPLLMEILDSIRRELRLESLKGGVWWFRFNRTKKEERFRISRVKERK